MEEFGFAVFYDKANVREHLGSCLVSSEGLFY